MTGSVLLCHHLGLGDHIMCHGIVREYCKRYGYVTIFSKPESYPSVAFMYRDLENLTIVPGDDAFAREYIVRRSSEYTEVKRVGFEFRDPTSGVPYEKQFYALAGVDVQKIWDNFYVQRDLAREQKLYEKASLTGRYVFLHEDRSRDFTINRKKIHTLHEIFEVQEGQTENIFDYCTLIERAQEIHVIDSSFMFLIDCLTYDNPEQKIFIHRYARPNPEWKLPILRKKWVIIGTSTPSLPRRIIGVLKRTAYHLRGRVLHT